MIAIRGIALKDLIQCYDAISKRSQTIMDQNLKGYREPLPFIT